MIMCISFWLVAYAFDFGGGGDGENQLFQMDQNQGRAIRRISLAGRLWGVLGESVRSRNRRYLHQRPGTAPSEDDISRRIPALSGTPSGRLRRALCLGLRICTGPSGRESLLDSSPRPLAWAERSPWRCHHFGNLFWHLLYDELRYAF